MNKLVFVTLTALAIPSSAVAQLQDRPQLPREWYAAVVLWNYGEYRPERQMAGCLRWGAHTRTWYANCLDKGPRHARLPVRH